jgi:hypothetical protein
MKVLCTGGAYYVPFSCLLISNKFCIGGVKIIANFRSGVISSLCLNIFLPILPGSGKRQDWVYLSSEHGVFNELDFNIVIIASFEPT